MAEAIARPLGEWRGYRFWRHRGWVAFGVVGAFLVVAFAAPWIAPHDPLVQDLGNRLSPPFAGPTHLLGTDALGRDILSRLIEGSRISLLVGVGAAVVQGLIGIPLGLIAGYFGGRVDSLIMRLADVQLAVPSLILAIAVLGILGPSLELEVIVLGLLGWMQFARVTRAETLVLARTDLVAALRVVGASDLRIMRAHILPNAAASLLVIGSQQVAAMILAEAVLGYLGLSVPPPTPTWGSMVADGQTYLATAWWVATIPGLVIMSLVLALASCGDALTDIARARTTAG